MSANVKSLTDQATPWSKQVAWWVVVVEGAVALLLGLFVLFRPEQANARFIQLLGGYLFVTSALALYRIVAHKDVPSEPARYVRVGIGLVAGLVALFHPRLPTLDTAAATTVLAIGLFLTGILGMYGNFATRALGIRWGQVIVNAIYLLFAIVVFLHNRGDGTSSLDLVWWIGIISTGAGVALILYALRLRRSTETATPAVSAPEAPATALAGVVMGDQPGTEAVVESSQSPVGTSHQE